MIMNSMNEKLIKKFQKQKRYKKLDKKTDVFEILSKRKVEILFEIVDVKLYKSNQVIILFKNIFMK